MIISHKSRIERKRKSTVLDQKCKILLLINQAQETVENTSTPSLKLRAAIISQRTIEKPKARAKKSSKIVKKPRKMDNFSY